MSHPLSCSPHDWLVQLPPVDLPARATVQQLEPDTATLSIERAAGTNSPLAVDVLVKYQEISRNPKDADERERVEQLFQIRPEWWLPAAAKVPTREHDMVLYRIEIDRLTGRRVARPTE